MIKDIIEGAAVFGFMGTSAIMVYGLIKHGGRMEDALKAYYSGAGTYEAFERENSKFEKYSKFGAAGMLVCAVAMTLAQPPHRPCVYYQSSNNDCSFR